MGSIAAMSKRQMSPARARLLAAARAARYGLKELSAMLGRNPSYLQQYVTKNSPRVLPDAVRLQLAGILHIPDAELRDADPDVAAPPPLPIAAAAALGRGTATHRGATAARIRLVSEGDTSADAIAAATDTLTLGPFLSDAHLAIRLERPHGLVQPRHILLCDTEAPPRLGDLAYATAPDESPAVGMLVPAPGATGIFDGTATRALPETARIWRVIAILSA